MVSIIIPVYNVYECIDRCMESIVNQTYKDIEIILINDGSTDNSARKCEEWEKIDARIRYISKENEGLGPTRNLGVKLAKSDYIMFVDSDDWVDVTMVEKMMKKLIATNADMVVCDRYDVRCKDDSLTLVVQGIKEVVEVEKVHEIIAEISTSQWGKIYKKELFTKNGIEQPKHFYEDAITPIMVAMCKKVCYVNEPLYYYVIDRGGSITNNILGLDSLVEYLKTAVGLFQKHGLFEKFKESILEMCCKRVNWNMYHTEKVLNQKMADIRKSNEQFIEKYWGIYELNKWKNLQILENEFYIWGSYNLMTSMKMLMRMNTPRFPENHYAYSSIISAMDTENGTLNEVVVEHANAFRKNHLLKEFKRAFANKNLGEFSEINYFVIDFLDERFDIGEYDGKYITISEAFEDMKDCDSIILKRYCRGSVEIEELWKKSCLKYIHLLRKYFSDKAIVLVKMKLSEEYGSFDNRHKFDNISDIRKINEMLECYYDFFSLNCPEAMVVEVADSQWYYTDKNFRHGCHSWHLNEYMYREIKDRIEEVIWR